MEVVNSVEQETKVQRKRCAKRKNDALRFVNGNLTNIKIKKKLKSLVENFLMITLLAGAVEYADCTSAEGYPPNEVTCWPWVATRDA